MVTLQELNELGVGFVSLTEAFDLTTPTGRTMAGLLAAFAQLEREILRERVRAGIVQGIVKLIGHAGVAFTPPHENSRNGYLRGNGGQG
jgi:putative DNA-invertase from lambdoid prophage Rac